MRFRSGILWLFVGLIALVGCGRPQVGANNYRLIESLRTALSARRIDWLEENAKLISQRHSSGEMNDEQFSAFESILALARGDNWAEAEIEAIRLAKAQQPSPAELERMKSNKSSHEKK
ncbi:MAG: hypothetical protein HY288_08700 [Planctomycetia bacterium]|nr:hypothetical protein [Planctomycetia bacterium]